MLDDNRDKLSFYYCIVTNLLDRIGLDILFQPWQQFTDDLYAMQNILCSCNKYPSLRWCDKKIDQKF